MKLPPFGKCVCSGRLVPGHKLLVFAGAKAWQAARWYRDRGHAGEQRPSHVLVLPPDQTAMPSVFRWPVRQRAVVVVSTGDNDAELLPLFEVLQRDGAASIELYVCDPAIGASSLEWELLCIHWGHPFADPAVYHARAA